MYLTQITRCAEYLIKLNNFSVYARVSIYATKVCINHELTHDR